MDLVNNLQQLLYTQGLLVFPARCLQTGSIWPYLHGAVHNLINQPQSASFAFPKHPPRDDPGPVRLAGVPSWWEKLFVNSTWPLNCRPGVTRGTPVLPAALGAKAVPPHQSLGCVSTPAFWVRWTFVGATWCFANRHLPSVLQRCRQSGIFHEIPPLAMSPLGTSAGSPV